MTVFGYKRAGSKILLGMITAVNRENGRPVSLLILNYDKDFDLIDLSFLCTAKVHRRMGLAITTILPVIILVLKNPDLVNGIVANTTTLEKEAQEAYSKSLLLDKLNFSYFPPERCE